MPGFEVVGVVLGVLPLIVSALENYERIVDPIRTFRKYSKALQTFNTELNVQRNIFENECILILDRFVDGHELRDMLQDPSHSLRNIVRGDPNLDLTVSNPIGASYGQLCDILQLIKTSLDEIYEETRGLSDGLSRPPRTEVDSLDLKAWRRHVRQKLKLSLGKPSLNEKIGDLRHRNQALVVISQQIVRFNVSWSPSPTQLDVQSMKIGLEKIKTLRETAKTLHSHLERLWTCPKHTEHAANLRLCHEVSELYREANSKVSLDMALTYRDADQLSSASRNPVLLAIESTVEGTALNGRKDKAIVRFSEPPRPEASPSSQMREQTPVEVGERPRTSWFRRTLRTFGSNSTGKTSRSAKDKAASASKTNAELSRREPVRTQTVSAQTNTATELPLLDLALVPNFCLHVMESSNLGVSGHKVCMGYLTGYGSNRYMVYHQEPARRTSGETVSLSDMLAKNSQHQTIPRPDKWRLAGALSLAVLLYHSTPWLRSTLMSDDVLFFGSGDAALPASFRSPHLHSLTMSKGKGVDRSSHPMGSWVKNQMLYCLGVLLLEIEFEDTLDSLIQKSKLNGLSQINAPLANGLLLLKKRAGEQLGTLYGRIARMCLDCDFGLGLDEYSLDDPRVQKVFYARIVRQFQERMPEYSKIWPDEPSEP